MGRKLRRQEVKIQAPKLGQEGQRQREEWMNVEGKKTKRISSRGGYGSVWGRVDRKWLSRK